MSAQEQIRVLVVGGGGREHALAWKIAQSDTVSHVFIAPGNAGTALVGENLPITTTKEILAWLEQSPVDLVVISPDNYLAEGLTDSIQALGIPVFGPTKAAAEIEWSKSYAKKLMLEEGIPTAQSQTFTDYEKAQDYVSKQTFPLVIKANGLAFGKGVIIAETHKEAVVALDSMMKNKTFGDAGEEVVIEEFLKGREISVHAFCDGEDVLLFPSSQDNKRIYDGDKGPNTGGVGAIAPVPWVTEELLREIKDTIVAPCVQGLKKRGRPFVGVLYPGIMVTAEGPKVIEFNARFGDPEAQAYMRLLKTDLVEIMRACINNDIKKITVEWRSASACCVIATSGGYPEKYEEGKLIRGLETAMRSDVVIFHSGTKKVGHDFVTHGGRVLGVTAVAESLEKSLQTSYTAMQKVTFDGMYFRKDIGLKSL